MKNRILLLTMAAVLILGMVACQSPEDLTPSTSRKGINSITASFPNDDSDENIFNSEIDYESKTITIVIPYNYPLTSNNVITTSHLSKMRVRANLDDNVYITPALLYLDLTKDNYVTVTNQSKKNDKYKIVTEIRKSNKCAITKYNLPSAGLSGVINESEKIISIISVEDIGSVLADISISHGATISPNPSKEKIDYDKVTTVTVIAQNGKDKTVYTIKKAIPKKIELGIRPNSRKLLWAKKLVDIGLPDKHMTTGIAAIDDYVVLNTRAKNSVYLNSKTGEVAGNIDISSISGSLTNFYATADKGNNILISNLTPNAGADFKIWKIKGVTGSPESFISFTTKLRLGRKISVTGNVDENAIITAPIYAAGGKFARWQVIDGNLVSQTPTFVVAKGVNNWKNNADIVYARENDLNSDYFVAYYGAPYKFAWYDGFTNEVKTSGKSISSNWIVNATDYIVFNNAPYALHNSVNSFTWGKDDNIYFYDLNDSSLTNRIEVCDPGIYGAKALGERNANGTGDVAFKISKNGYYLYVYFMFTNGYVVCVQYDCIDM